MRKSAVLLALILASLALAACGGGGSSSSSTSAEETSGGAATESESGGGEEEATAGGEAEAEGGTAGSGAQVDFEANPEGQLAFEEKSATAKAGKDTIDFTNSSAVPHNVTIEDAAGEVVGETETITEGNGSAVVDLKPGKYTFFCSIPGHREAGMEGTLTVK
jgi:plastocyanin